jgi:hypothetical protein
VQAGQEVRVVDRSGDTAAVLRAVFEPRGVTVTSCTGRRPLSAAVASTADRPRPVLVVDVDQASETVLRDASSDGGPLVLLGRIESPDGEPADPPRGAAHLLKPFQYADLIRTVEAAIRRRSA